MNIKTSVLAVALAISGSHSAYAMSADVDGAERAFNTNAAVIDYDMAVANWAALWAPIDTTDPVYDLMIDAKIEKARASSAGFVVDNPEYLWASLPLYKVTNGQKHVHEKNTKASFMRLFDMAVAYRVGGEFQTQETLDNILFGVEYLLDGFYNENLDQHPKDNWHEWEIGTPKFLHDIMTLVYEHLPAEIITKAINASRYHQADPNFQYGQSSPHNQIPTTGANRVDAALIVLQRGIFDKNDQEIQLALDSIPDVLVPVSAKDGFYEDGSFIQHQDIPYIGTYGMILLSNISRIMVMIDNTGITLDDERYALVDQYLMSAVAPFLFKAQMMDAVNGRAISRGWAQNKGEGRGALSVLLRYYDSREGKLKKKLGGIIKEQLQTDQDVFFAKASDFKVLDVAQRILDDKRLKASGELEGNFTYYNQDRVVHRKEGYAFTLALHSNRIGNFECGAGYTENTKAWYTADGMTYLYDADHNQYTDWWPLIDPRHMAGTTTTGLDIGKCKGFYTYANKKKEMTWVGGVSNGEFGVYGADFMNTRPGETPAVQVPTTAKKSYFMFDDEIVMVGSDVKSSKTWGVSTVVENRKLNMDGSNEITVDGELWMPTVDMEKRTATNTYHVKGNVKGSQVGVYIPTDKSIELMWDQRLGNWNDLYPANNNNMEDTAVMGVTLLSKIPHDTGAGKVDDYAYTLLPQFSAKQTEKYAKKPDVEIVVQTSEAHAVIEKKQKVFAANVFTAAPVMNDYFESEGEFSVMTQRKGKRMNVWISQPTRTNEPVKVKFLDALGDTKAHDVENRVSWVDGFWSVDTTNLGGSTYHFSYRIQ
ncbi:polysaccharide lyase 8 family protein [Enterovibrio makurazakiensis]|uniref:polysaccharide lyase 8 family protein n=1 Tax=Enterovibrio makurazakiensis TaxID=2910232 RepID=UPI003D208024